MEKMKSYFKQTNRQNWNKIFEGLKENIKNFKGDCEVEVKSLNLKRSGQQLKSYWMLIESVQKWMNDKGNTFSKEEVSSYFKIQAGHSEIIKMYSVPKSIANKSDCSKEQMEAIINTILVFGAENGIVGVEIEDKELKSLLGYYK
jgi:hypothetical protein